jgi:hypothetical protein
MQGGSLMDTTMDDVDLVAPEAATKVEVASRTYTQYAYSVLHAGMAAVPIAAGLDKFLYFLVDWTTYFAPTISRTTGIWPTQILMAVGVIEIAAGLLVAMRPAIGGMVVAVWLWAIMANLMLIPGHYDIMLRDFGLSLGAIALSLMARDRENAA